MPCLKVLKFSNFRKSFLLPKCAFEMLQLEFGEMTPSIREAKVLVEV